MGSSFEDFCFVPCCAVCKVGLQTVEHTYGLPWVREQEVGVATNYAVGMGDLLVGLGCTFATTHGAEEG